MNRVEAALRRIAAELDTRQVSWALVGGFAVSARTEPRFTRDVDIAVAVADDGAAEALIRSLTAAGYGLVAVVEQQEVGRLATARLVTAEAGDLGVIVDLLFGSAGIEAETVQGADVLEILPGLQLPVAGVGYLVALKLLARDDRTRPQDAGDLRALGEVLDARGKQEARVAVRLIEARGYGRGRPLAALLESYLTGLSDDDGGYGER